MPRKQHHLLNNMRPSIISLHPKGNATSQKNKKRPRLKANPEHLSKNQRHKSTPLMVAAHACLSRYNGTGNSRWLSLFFDCKNSSESDPSRQYLPYPFLGFIIRQKLSICQAFFWRKRAFLFCRSNLKFTSKATLHYRFSHKLSFYMAKKFFL